MNYYTSDLHFGQQSLLANGKWHERPFTSVQEMNEELIKRWNKKITNADHVYILGDVGSRGVWNMHPECLAKLKGNKHLIIGNHDDVTDLRIQQLFVEICDYKELSDNQNGTNQKLVLSHYPIMMWNGQHRGSILLYGHLHNSIEEELFQKYLTMFNEDRKPMEGEQLCRAYNVGACLWNYEPVSLHEILMRSVSDSPRLKAGACLNERK